MILWDWILLLAALVGGIAIIHTVRRGGWHLVGWLLIVGAVAYLAWQVLLMHRAKLPGQGG